MISWYGRRRRLMQRFLISLLTSLVIGAVICIVWYRSILTAYEGSDLSISAACVDCLKTVPAGLSIRMMLILSITAKLVGLFLVTVLVNVCAMCHLERTAYYCIPAAVTGIPFLLCRLGAGLHWVTWMGCFQFEEVIKHSLGGSLLYLGFWLTAGCGLLFWSLHRMAHTGEGIQRFSREPHHAGGVLEKTAGKERVR